MVCFYEVLCELFTKGLAIGSQWELLRNNRKFLGIKWEVFREFNRKFLGNI